MQRKSVLRVTPAAMIRLSRSQSPFRESRSMNYEYKARSYGDAGTSSSGRRVKKTTSASRRARFNGVVALSATEFARVEECKRFPLGERARGSAGRPAPVRYWYAFRQAYRPGGNDPCEGTGEVRPVCVPHRRRAAPIRDYVLSTASASGRRGACRSCHPAAERVDQVIPPGCSAFNDAAGNLVLKVAGDFR